MTATTTPLVYSTRSAAGDEPALDPSRWSVLMTLADGRLPTGAYAYSGGMEQFVAWGDVTELGDLEAWIAGRVGTAAPAGVQVAVAASVVARSAPPRRWAPAFDALDRAVDARTATAAGRTVSRQQGRRWWRAAHRCWPEELAPLAGPIASGRHAWVTLGAAAGILDIAPAPLGTLVLYELISTPLWAAVRLLGLDPFDVAALVTATLSWAEPPVAVLARHAAVDALPLCRGSGSTEWISWSVAPLADLAAESHLEREERLFAS